MKMVTTLNKRLIDSSMAAGNILMSVFIIASLRILVCLRIKTCSDLYPAPPHSVNTADDPTDKRRDVLFVIKCQVTAP